MSRLTPGLPPPPTASQTADTTPRRVVRCRNRFTPFLCVDPRPAAQPLPRDAEEYVEVLRMPAEQLRDTMCSGEMLTPSVLTCVLALAHLERHGFI